MALTVDVVLWVWGLWWCSELKAAGVEVNVITIGRKGTTYYKSRTKLLRSFEMGQVRTQGSASEGGRESCFWSSGDCIRGLRG
jgi:hypothetical protein